MPNTPSPEDDFDDIYDMQTIENMTPMDALIVAGLLLDSEMPVPTDIIAKAHSGGLYIAH